MWTFIIGTAIVLYSFWVIRTEIKKRKQGQSFGGCCGGSCGQCSRCHDKK